MTPPSDRVLAELPGRVQRFLTALVRQPRIFAALANTCGYNKKHHKEGLDLLTDLIGTVPDADALPDTGPLPDRDAQQALEACDALDGPLLTRLEGALSLRHPEVHRTICGGLSPDTGVSAIGNLRLIVDRYQALREEGGEAAEAAIDTLKARDMGPGYFREVESLVNKAEAFDVKLPHPGSWAEELHARQLALYTWWVEWSENARRAVDNRRWLISLGLAYRRTSDDEGGSDTPAP